MTMPSLVVALFLVLAVAGWFTLREPEEQDRWLYTLGVLAVCIALVLAMAGCARRVDVGVHRVAGVRCPAGARLLYVEHSPRADRVEPFVWCADSTRAK